MDNRIETREKNLAVLEDGFSNFKVDNEHVHIKLSSIESLLQTIAHGKSIVEEREISTQNLSGKEDFTTTLVRRISSLSLTDELPSLRSWICRCLMVLIL